jgi:DNA-binding LacI/PurR family transcriptional regulator
MAGETLYARGYRRLAFLGGPETATSTQDRLVGFLEALADAPGAEVSYSFATAYSFDAGRVEMTKQLMTDPAEAYFCGDDVLSIGALSAVQSAGLRVPDDIGLIGLNDMEMARWENINLTTIRQPLPQIIGGAIEMMTALLEDPAHPPSARRFECEIIDRGTLRPMPVPRIARNA